MSIWLRDVYALRAMKTLAEMISLEGQHEEISMTELRSKPGEVLTQVSLGKTFTVSNSGKPIAEIKKPEEPFDWAALQRLRKISA